MPSDRDFSAKQWRDITPDEEGNRPASQVRAPESNDTDRLRWWLVSWVVVTAIAAGIAGGKLIPTTEAGYFSDNESFGWPAFFGFAIAALIASIPTFVFFHMGDRLLTNLIAVKALLRLQGQAPPEGK